MAISKSFAAELSAHLIKDKSDANIEKTKKDRNEIRDILLKYIDKDLIALSIKFPNAVYSDNSFNCDGLVGTNYLKIGTSIPRQFNNLQAFNLSALELKTIRKLANDINYNSNSIINLRKDLEDAIYKLRTERRVLEAFPELAGIIKGISSSGTVVDINSLKTQLK